MHKLIERKFGNIEQLYKAARNDWNNIYMAQCKQTIRQLAQTSQFTQRKQRKYFLYYILLSNMLCPMFIRTRNNLQNVTKMLVSFLHAST